MAIRLRKHADVAATPWLPTKFESPERNVRRVGLRPSLSRRDTRPESEFQLLIFDFVSHPRLPPPGHILPSLSFACPPSSLKTTGQNVSIAGTFLAECYT